MARVPADRTVRLPVVAGRRPGLALIVALALPMGLGACASTFSGLPAQMGGLPADTPQSATAPAAYPAVHDMPPPRQNSVLTEAEQKQAEAELAALRARQAKQVVPVPKTQ